MSSDRILSQLLGSGAASGFAGGLAGGLASGLFTSKAGRKLGKKALKVGGIAAVGGLAYAAFQKYRAGDAPAGPSAAGHLHAVPRAGEAAALGAGEAGAFGAGAPQLERFIPAPGQRGEAAAEALGVTLLRAMVAAAHADGKLDRSERHALYEHIDGLELDGSEKAELLLQLRNPVDMGTLVLAASTPEIASEIYAASLLAIDVDTPAERAYLEMLAARLGLPGELVEAIHREAGVPTGTDAAPAPLAVGA